MYFLLEILIIWVSFFFPSTSIKFSNFSSLPKGKTKSPFLLTKIFFLLKIILFFEIVLPNSRPPCIKLPLRSKLSEKTLEKGNYNYAPRISDVKIFRDKGKRILNLND